LELVSLTLASWNQITVWLRRLNDLRAPTEETQTPAIRRRPTRMIRQTAS
jgi:hypothetical protein